MVFRPAGSVRQRQQVVELEVGWVVILVNASVNFTQFELCLYEQHFRLEGHWAGMPVICSVLVKANNMCTV